MPGRPPDFACLRFGFAYLCFPCVFLGSPIGCVLPPYNCGIPRCLGTCMPNVPTLSTSSMSLYVLPLMLMLVCEWLSAVTAAPSPTFPLPLLLLLFCIHTGRLGPTANGHILATLYCCMWITSSIPQGGTLHSCHLGYHSTQSWVSFLSHRLPLPSVPEQSSKRPPWVISSSNPSTYE